MLNSLTKPKMVDISCNGNDRRKGKKAMFKLMNQFSFMKTNIRICFTIDTWLSSEEEKQQKETILLSLYLALGQPFLYLFFIFLPLLRQPPFFFLTKLKLLSLNLYPKKKKPSLAKETNKSFCSSFFFYVPLSFHSKTANYQRKRNLASLWTRKKWPTPSTFSSPSLL